MLVAQRKEKLISYVGYTNNLSKRLNLHNQSKGAKFTRGSNALKAEHKLKKNYLLRKKIKQKYLNV